MYLAAQGILPPAVVLPVAALAVLVVTAHLVAVRADSAMPLSRKRLRTASGVVMLCTTLVLAHAFAFVGEERPARFAAAWSAAVLLLVIVLTLAGLDALNNVRLARIQRRRIRRQAGDLYAQLAEALAGAARDRRATTDGPADAQPRPAENEP